jgi:hypothetical protein
MKNWREGKLVEVKTPDYVRDNVPVDLLAEVYVLFIQKLASADALFLKVNPSGYAEKQGEFSRRVAQEVKVRTGWDCKLKLAQQEDFSEPLNRTNTESARQLVPAWNEVKAWDAFVQFYQQR